jgi:hypothetical protein
MLHSIRRNDLPQYRAEDFLIFSCYTGETFRKSAAKKKNKKFIAKKISLDEIK